jgi:long-subunit fatty acid transport protein
MGNAYTGIADDFSAVYWNPAGLAQMERSEFSIGLANMSVQDNSSYLGSTSWHSANGTNLNTLGVTLDVPARQGNLVLSFGYSRNTAFVTGLTFSGFNPDGSIIQTWAPHDEPYPEDITIAEELGLAIADTSTGRFVSPIDGMLTQEGSVYEGGGIDNWSIAGAVDVAQNVSVGATLSFLSGSYSYDREYSEIDSRNVYSAFPYDLDQLVVSEFVRSDVSGFNAHLGMMYRVPGFLGFGLSVRTPTSYSITEEFGRTADSYFDNGDILPAEGSYQTIGFAEYEVVTPWVFGAGLSLRLLNLTVSGDIQYTDWTQLKFDRASPDVMALNSEIKQIFRPAANLRVGAEWNPFGLGLRFRAGAMVNQSPYEKDKSIDYDQKYLTAGLGLPLGEFVALDLAYAYGWWTTDRINYDAATQIEEDVVTHNAMVTFSFRF